MKQDEHHIQCGVIKWAQMQESKYPELKLLHAIPNGGHRHLVVARKLKAEGVKSGVPDLFLPVARQNYHGLYIEMKTPKGKIQDSQKWWLEELDKQGYYCVVCREVEQTIETIISYLKLTSSPQNIVSAPYQSDRLLAKPKLKQ